MDLYYKDNAKTNSVAKNINCVAPNREQLKSRALQL
jgi:hypothetical protein